MEFGFIWRSLTMPRRRDYTVSGQPKKKGSVAVKKLRAAIYTRVSTEDQAKEGFSLGAQLDRNRSFCDTRGYVIAGEYVEEGASGRDTKGRSEYLRMMADMEKWDLILVMKMDRIHRSSKNFLLMMDTLQKHGKDFVSMTESLDTSTAMGRFVMGIIQSIAQLESEQIGERVFVGMTQKASTGAIALGQKAPYGYRWSEPSPKGKWWGSGEWLVNESEAKEVRAVFDQFLQGNGAQRIAASLKWCTCVPKLIHRIFKNKDGSVRRYDGFEKRSHCAGCSRVRYMLRNPAYAGYFVFAGKVIKGHHKPIVTRKKFEQAQARFAARKWTHPGAWTPLPDES